MSVVRFIADQRTFYRVPYAVCCAILGVSQSWFYKWFNRPTTVCQERRGNVDAAHPGRLPAPAAGSCWPATGWPRPGPG